MINIKEKYMIKSPIQEVLKILVLFQNYLQNDIGKQMAKKSNILVLV